MDHVVVVVVVVGSMRIGGACRDGVTRKVTSSARFAIRFASFSFNFSCPSECNLMIYRCMFVQEFKPDYTAPPPLLELGHVPLHFRGNWGISQREHRFITVVPADSTFIDQQYPLSSTTSFICCRSLVLIVRTTNILLFPTKHFDVFYSSLCL